MANSKYGILIKIIVENQCDDGKLSATNRYEYVRDFEQPDRLLPNTWIVVRIDGRGFHKCTHPSPLLSLTL